MKRVLLIRSKGRASDATPCRWLAVTLVLFLSACSTVEFLYNQADRLLSYTVNRYFDLTESQQVVLDDRVAVLMAWHRHEELPDYARFLMDAKVRLERGLRSDDLDWFADGLILRYRRLAERVGADAAVLMASLDERQLEHCRAEFAARNEEWAAEWHLLDAPAERAAWRKLRVLEVAEDWVGTLAEQQRERIERAVELIPADGVRLRWEDRLRRQQGFLTLLAARREGAFAERFRDWLVHWEWGRAPDYQRYLDRLNQEASAMVLDVDRSLTPAQRAHLAGRVQALIDPLAALMAR
ncbi:DUF6279 family lipoprotein [Methylotetracoccus oryzae]|uniref:DUF6279 family lipoprotein n=1 Tax=Methylotetracoccus oryzae TaxID=1919059 RepID=UPI001117BA43|nr:DUF6279 family lipoprotein [Methylotetracoccus oryzae]